MKTRRTGGQHRQIERVAPLAAPIVVGRRPIGRRPSSRVGGADTIGRMAHRVTLIPGDGIGPELAEATRRVLEATGVGFDWDVRHAGVDVMETAGTPLPD